MTLFNPAESRKSLSGQLVWFSLWLVVTAFGIYLRPNHDLHGTHTQLGLPPCPCVLLFRRPCPGCGLTTSWSATIHGQFDLAFQAHPLGPLIYLIFSVSALLCIWGYIKKQALISEGRVASVSASTLIIGFLAFGVIRFSTTLYKDPLPDLYAYLLPSAVTGEKSGKATRVPKQDATAQFSISGQTH